MHTVINLEERIGKTVGRRTAPGDAFRYGMALQKLGVELDKTFGCRFLPKGCYKFHSHEEADSWLMTQLIRRAKS